MKISIGLRSFENLPRLHENHFVHFLFVFLFWGCGQEEQPVVPKPPEKKPLASVNLAKLQLRGDLLYLQNTGVPFSGEAKSYYEDGQLRADALIQKGKLKSLKRLAKQGGNWKWNSAKALPFPPTPIL